VLRAVSKKPVMVFTSLSDPAWHSALTYPLRELDEILTVITRQGNENSELLKVSAWEVMKLAGSPLACPWH
jgi:hypothetical protein